MRCRLLLLMCAMSLCHTGSFGAAFVKSLWPLVILIAAFAKSVDSLTAVDRAIILLCDVVHCINH